jgi:FixJ family two-component response regulator
MMPGMSGLDVLQQLRGRESDVPVVMITAHGSIDVAVRAMKLGARDFIVKPFEPDHIALIVRKASTTAGSPGTSPSSRRRWTSGTASSSARAPA